MTNLPPLPPLPPLPGGNNPHPQNNNPAPPVQSPPVPPAYAAAPTQQNVGYEQSYYVQPQPNNIAPKKPNSKGKLFLWIGLAIAAIVIIVVGLLVVPKVIETVTGGAKPAPQPNGSSSAPSDGTSTPSEAPADSFVVNELKLASGKTLTITTPKAEYWQNYEPIAVDTDAQFGNSATATQIVTDVIPEQNCAVQSIIFDNSSPSSPELVQETMKAFAQDPNLGQPKDVKTLTYNNTKMTGYEYSGFSVNGRSGTSTAVTFGDEPGLVAYTMFYCEDPAAQKQLSSTQFNPDSTTALFYDLK